MRFNQKGNLQDMMCTVCGLTRGAGCESHAAISRAVPEDWNVPFGTLPDPRQVPSAANSSGTSILTSLSHPRTEAICVLGYN